MCEVHDVFVCVLKGGKNSTRVCLACIIIRNVMTFHTKVFFFFCSCSSALHSKSMSFVCTTFILKLYGCTTEQCAGDEDDKLAMFAGLREIKGFTF